MKINQIKKLVETTSNDTMLGAKVRELYWKDKNVNEVVINPNQIDLEDMINEVEKNNKKNQHGK